MGIIETFIKESTKKAVGKHVSDSLEKVAIRTLDSIDVYNKNQTEKTCSRLPFSSESYYHENYNKIVEELNAYGFTNIALIPIKDLIKGWLINDGAVEKIIINGDEEISKKKNYPIDSRIVIQYHTFKDNV